MCIKRISQAYRSDRQQEHRRTVLLHVGGIGRKGHLLSQHSAVCMKLQLDVPLPECLG